MCTGIVVLFLVCERLSVCLLVCLSVCLFICHQSQEEYFSVIQKEWDVYFHDSWLNTMKVLVINVKNGHHIH